MAVFSGKISCYESKVTAALNVVVAVVHKQYMYLCELNKERERERERRIVISGQKQRQQTRKITCSHDKPTREE